MLLFAASIVAIAVQAQPQHCSPGFQDSSCFGVLLNAPQVAPTCTSGAGYTTTSPAVWQGSKYSTPSCSYTPPPTCGSNMTQTAAPTWNGSAWVGLACTPVQTPPPVTLPTIVLTNNATSNANFYEGPPDPTFTFTLLPNGTVTPTIGWSDYNSGRSVTFNKWASNAPNTTGSDVQVMATVTSGNEVLDYADNQGNPITTADDGTPLPSPINFGQAVAKPGGGTYTLALDPGSTQLGQWLSLGSARSFSVTAPAPFVQYMSGGQFQVWLQLQFRGAVSQQVIGTVKVQLTNYWQIPYNNGGG
jgi:hypothetical protein